MNPEEAPRRRGKRFFWAVLLLGAVLAGVVVLPRTDVFLTFWYAHNLRGEDIEARAAAMKHLALRQWRVKDLCPILVAGLKEESPAPVQVAAVEALGSLGEKALPWILAELEAFEAPERARDSKSKDKPIHPPHERLITALTRSAIGSVELLRLALLQRSVAVQDGLCYALRHRGTAAASEFRELLKHGQDFELCDAALSLLETYMSKDASPVLGAIALAASDPAKPLPLRRRSAGALVRLTEQPASAVPALLRCVADTDVALRKASLIALSAYVGHARTAVPVVSRVAWSKTEPAELRVAAMACLRRIASAEEWPLDSWEKALGEPAPEVRAAAASCFRSFKSPLPSSCARLAALLADEAGEVAYEAREGLARAGAAGVPALLPLLEGEMKLVAESILWDSAGQNTAVVKALQDALPTASPASRRSIEQILDRVVPVTRSKARSAAE